MHFHKYIFLKSLKTVSYLFLDIISTERSSFFISTFTNTKDMVKKKKEYNMNKYITHYNN